MRARKTCVVGTAVTSRLGFALCVVSLVRGTQAGAFARRKDCAHASAPTPHRWSDTGGGFDIPFLGFISFIVGVVVIVLGTCKFATYAGRKIGLAQKGMQRV